MSRRSIFPFPRRTVLAAACMALVATTCSPCSAGPDVTTYHNDNRRTGWNPNETSLTPATIASPGFGLLYQVPLDQQVDAQPLFVSRQPIKGRGRPDVVYVVTENNTVYAIEADTGSILLTRNLGTPVPDTALGPYGCGNNSGAVGINATPVIDPNSHTLYVMAYSYENGSNVYRLHALDPRDLSDTLSPVVVTASAPLEGGKVYSFRPRYQRQRAALLETAGNIYAAFGSFCDSGTDLSRGWVLGWNAATLKPLANTELINQLKRTKNRYFLSSVWMSGAGIASDDDGNLYFATGNGDPDGRAYDPPFNLEESLIRMPADLGGVDQYFTPGNYRLLDASDNEIGGGGVLLLPKQHGSVVDMAVLAGKKDRMYLLDRDHLGGDGGGNPMLGAYTNNGRWCMQSYYTGDDGMGRVVSSTGSIVSVWAVHTRPRIKLVNSGNSVDLNSGQDPGFFTSISSNGTASATAVVWAVPHPQDSDPNHTITLYAFDPEGGDDPLWSGAAGIWPYAANADANIVPTVANGRVFVATYANLSVFGLANGAAAASFAAPAVPTIVNFGHTKHQITGIVLALKGDVVTLRTRNGHERNFDIATARHNASLAQPSPGQASMLAGDASDTAGNLIPTFIMHAKTNPNLWLPDR